MALSSVSVTFCGISVTQMRSPPASEILSSKRRFCSSGITSVNIFFSSCRHVGLTGLTWWTPEFQRTRAQPTFNQDGFAVFPRRAPPYGSP